MIRRSLTLLDRYLISQLLRSTFGGSLVAVVVLLGLQILRLSDLIIRYDLETASVAQMLSGLALSFTPLVLPIAFLFALLGVFGRMSADREFIALQALGQSPQRILRPAYICGAVVMLLTFWASFVWGPQGNRRFEISIDEAFKRRVTSALRSGTFSEGFLDMVIFVDRVDPMTQDLDRVFIHDEQSFSDEVSISARKGRWMQAPEEGLGILKLQDGIMVSQVNSKNIVRRVHFDEYNLNADFSRQAGSSRMSPPSLDGLQLLSLRSENKAHPERDPRPVWVEIARRLAVTFVTALFVPLCFALSVDNRRTAKSRAILTGLGVLLGYWTFYFALVTWLLKTQSRFIAHSEIVNWLVIWLPNLFVGLIGWRLFRRHSGELRS